MAYEIAGPLSIGPEVPQPSFRPVSAVSPAGAVSVPWPLENFDHGESSMAGLAQNDFAPATSEMPWWQRLIYSFVPYEPVYEPNGEPYYPPPDIPTYRVETACPYGQSIWPWVLGTAIVVMLLTQKK